MAAVPALIGRLGLDSSRWQSGMIGARRSIGSFSRGASQSFAALSAKAGVVAGAIIGIKKASDLATSILTLGARAETTAVTFEVLIGNAQESKRVLRDLQRFAASTPFQLPGLQTAAKKLLAFGFSTNELLPQMKRMGDLASGLGIDIGELAEIYGKARVQGTLFSEDINQLTGRGIPVIQEFAKQLGVSESQVKKMASQGKITFENLEQAFVSLTGEGGKFNGLMERQSETIAGKWSTMKDNINAALMEIGKAIFETFDFKWAIDQVTKFAKRAIPVLRDIVKVAGVLLKNWKSIWQIAQTSAALQILRVKETVVHFFTAAMPKVLRNFVDNWIRAFRQVAKAAIDLISAANTFDFKKGQAALKKLMSGSNEFTTNLVANIPQRRETDAERQLRGDMTSMISQLGMQIQNVLRPPEKNDQSGFRDAGALQFTKPAAEEQSEKTTEERMATKLSQAITRDSAAAYSTIVRAQRTSPEVKHLAALEKTDKQILLAIKTQTEVLENMEPTEDVRSFRKV